MLLRTQLLAMLRAHQAGTPDEQTHQSRMLSLLDTAGDPFSRKHLTPGHFTASAFVVCPNHESLLLIHHRKLDRWLQPGGHVEASDTDLVESARRELREEVGIGVAELVVDGIFDLDVHPIPALGDEAAHEHFDARFLFRADSLELRASDEVKAARFFPIGSINAVQSDESVMRAVRKLRAMR